MIYPGPAKLLLQTPWRIFEPRNLTSTASSTYAFSATIQSGRCSRDLRSSGKAPFHVLVNGYDFPTMHRYVCTVLLSHIANTPSFYCQTSTPLHGSQHPFPPASPRASPARAYTDARLHPQNADPQSVYRRRERKRGVWETFPHGEGEMTETKKEIVLRVPVSLPDERAGRQSARSQKGQLVVHVRVIIVLR